MAKEKKETRSLNDLDILMKSMDAKFGKGNVFIMGDSNNLFSNIERWETTSLIVNDVLGGGIPKARMGEIFGPESAGKTSLCCYFAGQIQQNGGVVAYIDAEHALDVEYAKTFNFDIKKCIFNQPEFGEQALDIAIALAESGKVDLIVIDSIPSLTPKSELEGEMSDQQMGAQSRMLGKFYRKIIPILGKTKCALIMVNQIRMNFKAGPFSNPEMTPGGNATKFAASWRIDIRRKEYLEKGTNDDKLQIGIISRIKAIKNKVGIPMKFGNIKILYGKGIQVEEEYIDFALTVNILERKGAWYFWEGVQLGCGLDKVIEYFKANPKMYEKLKKDTKARLNPTVNLDGSVIENNGENEDEIIDDDSGNDISGDTANTEILEDKENIEETETSSKVISKVHDLETKENKSSTETNDISINTKRRGRPTRVNTIIDAVNLTTLENIKPLEEPIS